MRAWGPRGAAAALTLALTMVVAQAAAQSDEDRAAARAIAMQGVAQEEAEHWTEAIDLFRRAESLVHAPPHLLHIARAEVKLRRLVAGRESYLAIAREELSTNAPRAFVDAQAAAQKELAELEPRIPTLKVLVDGGQGAVTADGAPMSSALIGVERPIDPGRHELRAAGSGMASKLVVIDLAEGVHETVHLLLEPSGAATPTDDSPSTSTEMERSGGSKVGAFVAWGVGAAGLVVGTTMMLVNRSKRDEADAICPSGSCPTSRRADVESLDADANRAATLSWVGFGVGVVGLGVGTVLFFMKGGKPANEPQHAAAAVVPWVGVGGAGLSGRF